MKPVAPPLVYSVAALGILMWGASPAATKMAVQSFDGFSLAVLRSFLAALLILPFALLRRLPIPQKREHRWTLASAAVIGIVCYSILFSYGLERTSTIHAALQFALPIVSIALGMSLFDENLNWQITLATVIILSGIFITKKA